mmetsp:Transcript_120540/g.169569  ORF Transcript_120540/g.169569 Transcript_120540/m.169569 type:complete len:206 (+) Transcript_120540:526-1143(+)
MIRLRLEGLHHTGLEEFYPLPDLITQFLYGTLHLLGHTLKCLVAHVLAVASAFYWTAWTRLLMRVLHRRYCHSRRQSDLRLKLRRPSGEVHHFAAGRVHISLQALQRQSELVELSSKLASVHFEFALQLRLGILELDICTKYFRNHPGHFFLACFTPIEESHCFSCILRKHALDELEKFPKSFQLGLNILPGATDGSISRRLRCL